MIAASLPVQRPPDAKLLALAVDGSLTHWSRSDFVTLLQPGDVVIANDAATLPASLMDGICRPDDRSKCDSPVASRSSTMRSSGSARCSSGKETSAPGPRTGSRRRK